jgi:hypothetical protein
VPSLQDQQRTTVEEVRHWLGVTEDTVQKVVEQSNGHLAISGIFLNFKLKGEK